MTDVEIIRLINSYLIESNRLESNIESLKFIINFKNKTAIEYLLERELQPREKLFEYKRINCAASINLLDSY